MRPKNNKALDDKGVVSLKLNKGVVSLKLNGDYRPMILGLAMIEPDTKSRVMETFKDHCRQLINSDNIPGMTPKLLLVGD